MQKNKLNTENTDLLKNLYTLLELEQLLMSRQSETYFKFKDIEGHGLANILTSFESDIFSIIYSRELYVIKESIEMANQLILKQEKAIYEYGLKLVP
ncbi:MAG: hypothetical protein RLZZ118_859 [Bacteroidota bacterium]|jgi:hypothetical protein